MSDARRRGLLWFAVAAPPAAWATLLVGAYAAEEAACTGGRRAAGVLGAGAVEPVFIALALAAVAVALAAAVAAALSRRGRMLTLESGSADGLLLVAAVVSCGLFLALILMSAAAVLPFDPCEPA